MGIPHHPHLTTHTHTHIHILTHTHILFSTCQLRVKSGDLRGAVSGLLSSACTELMTAWSVCNRWRSLILVMVMAIVLMCRSFKERIQETEEAHGLLNNHLQTTVQVKVLPYFLYFLTKTLWPGDVWSRRTYCYPEVRLWTCWMMILTRWLCCVRARSSWYHLDQVTLLFRRALEAKKPPLKVAETRLANRSHRPNIEVRRYSLDDESLQPPNFGSMMLVAQLAMPIAHIFIYTNAVWQ